MGSLASKVETGVWVQAPAALLRESGGGRITPRKISRL